MHGQNITITEKSCVGPTIILDTSVYTQNELRDKVKEKMVPIMNQDHQERHPEPAVVCTGQKIENIEGKLRSWTEIGATCSLVVGQQ
jgi:hypothetical protein